MTANKIDELIPFETYKEVFEKNSIEDFPALSNLYPSNSTPKLIDQELVGFILGLPLGKEQIGNEQKGFGVRHAFVRGVGGGAVLPSDQAEIYIKFPREGCSYTFEEASKSIFFDRFSNAKGREKGLTVIRVSLAYEACVTFKDLIKANKGHQFETAFRQSDDNHHMTAVIQFEEHDFMWLDHVATEREWKIVDHPELNPALEAHKIEKHEIVLQVCRPKRADMNPDYIVRDFASRTETESTENVPQYTEWITRLARSVAVDKATFTAFGAILNSLALPPFWGP
ncbi:hypothetical protein M431DRAFT_19838 [Trichoderma harzianum CBS 226.95]|uniref:Uncharacterized protein n=1 Tax=Trichoderma harzianum CBS 226.95 TaxID=983964 RepID=A0A2T4A028_TRIHA|nr:hypothetical protein M431DRAFT_19838 [Trichoderma harzianum CBS 226.95]PTB50416.1 hypothetical protein M431DRAFT_19838 [Trichoderma harzianum CBS 226.95]